MRFGLKRKPAKLSEAQEEHVQSITFSSCCGRCLFTSFMHLSDFFKACRKKYYHRRPHGSDIEIAKTAALISRVEIQRAIFFYIAIEKQIRRRLTPRSFSRVLA